MDDLNKVFNVKLLWKECKGFFTYCTINRFSVVKPDNPDLLIGKILGSYIIRRTQPIQAITLISLAVRFSLFAEAFAKGDNGKLVGGSSAMEQGLVKDIMDAARAGMMIASFTL